MIRYRLLAIATLLSACATDATPSGPDVSEVAQAVSVCAGPTTTYGIDVSRFQGDINWDMVAASDVKFAFIQISRSLTDIDAKFPYNWKRAKEVGILRGAYQRFHPGEDVIAQADLFLAKLGPFQAGDLPPVLDVEDQDAQTATQIAAKVRQWVEYVEQKLGVRPIIYTNFYFWRDKVGGADFSDYPLWIANYGSSCPLVPGAWDDWTIHQYSSTVNVPGITANTCDVNKFNGTLAELQALAKPPEPCASIDTSTEAGAIVDESSSCFTAGGNPTYIRTENAGFGSSLKWTHATDSAEASNYGRWDLTFAAGGRYRVEAYTAAPFAMSTQAVYEVHHAGATTDAAVDQTAVDGWSLVGEFEFAPGGEGQLIQLGDNTGEPNSTDTQLVFDALRFTLIEDGAKDDGVVEPPAPPDGGCATGRGQAGGLAGLLLLGLAVRRRRR
jgi:MYXO-CTERM domain-containing protein